MVRLADRDVRSALELVWNAGEYTGVDPFPREFLGGLASLTPVDALVGYHELFHALTIVAVVCQYVAIALVVV